MPGAPGNFNSWAWAPGNKILWDQVNGGAMLLNPPTRGSIHPAGFMDFTTMQNRVWHLLREPGPDNGYPVPQTGDFPQEVVERDLNIMLGQFISATGLAPTLSDRQVTVPVFAVQDMPLPPDYQSLTNVDYTPAGGVTYSLLATSFSEWNAYYTGTTALTGIPERYRQPWAGYIRLWPQPGPGQANGPGIGTVTFSGTPVVGNTVALTITNNPAAPVHVPTYTVTAADVINGLPQIATNVANAVNASSAVQGPNAFIQQVQASDGAFQLTAIAAPGTNITYSVTTVSSTMTVSPNGQAFFMPNGDTMTYYYSSTGSTMVYPNDTPGIPPQFHMAIVYGVLADYWLRKQDPDGLAKVFKTRFDEAVGQAKRLEWDSDRATAPTAASFSDDVMDYAGYY